MTCPEIGLLSKMKCVYNENKDYSETNTLTSVSIHLLNVFYNAFH